MLNSDVLDKKVIRKKTAATVLAVIAAVVLPQVFHSVGIVSGTGPALGQSFLPMHLPILIAALIAGPVVGIIAGLFSPLISFALTGMPASAMLPFMMVELLVYGFAAGALKDVKLPVILKVIIAQFFGRGVRAAAILASFYIFNIQAVSSSVILSSIVKGLPGLILQWSIIPLFIFWYNKRGENE